MVELIALGRGVPLMPHPDAFYDPVGLLLFIVPAALCGLVLLLVMFSLRVWRAAPRLNRWRVGLRIAASLLAAWAAALILGDLAIYRQFVTDPIYRAGGFSGTNHDRYVDALSAGIGLSLGTIASMLAVVGVRIWLALAARRAAVRA